MDPKAESFTGLSPYNSMGNSPMVNVDPNGDFFFGTLMAPLAGFVRGIRNLANGEGVGGFVEGFGQGLSNGVKIDAGNFAWDRNLNVFENDLTILSRFSWQAPQQLAGNIYNAAHNVSGQVDWVRYKHGATVVSSGMQPGGISLGSYITGGTGNIEADPFNSLFQHEYGHYLQSVAMGPAYLWRVGIPSVQSAGSNTSPYGDHDFHPVEQDANRRAFSYFNREVNGFYGASRLTSGWNFDRNPLDPGRTARRNQFFNFRNAADRRQLQSLSVRARWTDYVFGPFAGVTNAIIYNNP